MAYIAKIKDTSGTTGVVASCLYGTCSTAASTAEKAVTCADFDTTMANCPTGLTIYVKFTNSNTATTPTLNVNSKGAKSIYKYGTTKPGTTANTSWQAGSVVSFTYDGSYWQMNNHLDDTTYSSLAAASGGTAVSLVTTGEKYSWNAKSGSDVNVQQTATDTASSSTPYPLLFGASDTTTTTTEGARKTQYLTYDPYYKKICLNDEFYGTSTGGLCSTMYAGDVGIKYYQTENDGETPLYEFGANFTIWGSGSSAYSTAEIGAADGSWMTISNQDAVLHSNTWDGTNTSLKTAIGSARDVVKQVPTSSSTDATQGYPLIFSNNTSNSTITSNVQKSEYLKYYTGSKSDGMGGTMTYNGLGLYNPTNSSLNEGVIGINLTAQSQEINMYMQANDSTICALSIQNHFGGSSDICLTGSTWDGTNASLRTAITDKLSKTGGTMTDDLTMLGSGKRFIASSSNSAYTCSLQVGGGGTNRGLYDDTSNKWMIYCDSNGKITTGGALYTPIYSNTTVAITPLKNKMSFYRTGMIVYFTISSDFTSTGLASRTATNVGTIPSGYRPIAQYESGLMGSNNQIQMQLLTNGTISMYNFTTSVMNSGWFRFSGCYITQDTSP